ncbi:hypothetical protein HDV00_005565 [Rhizophlyctis rosea]|nr:hypothetical protein HDV00_005565 [Rhizophlyctis rosea]
MKRAQKTLEWFHRAFEPKNGSEQEVAAYNHLPPCHLPREVAEFCGMRAERWFRFITYKINHRQAAEQPSCAPSNYVVCAQEPTDTTKLVNTHINCAKGRQPIGYGQDIEDHLRSEGLWDNMQLYGGEGVHTQISTEYLNGVFKYCVKLNKPVPLHLLKTLNSSMNYLKKNKGLKFKPDPERGQGATVVQHLAFWQKYCTEPAYSEPVRDGDDSERPFTMSRQIRAFRSANKPLWRYVGDVLKTHFPSEYRLFRAMSQYMRKKYKRKLKRKMKFIAGIFPAVAVNLNMQALRHLDAGDFPRIVLLLEEIGARVPFPSGSIIFFRSAILTHGNTKYTEKVKEFMRGRRIIVLFVEKNMLKWWARKEGIKINIDDFIETFKRNELRRRSSVHISI